MDAKNATVRGVAVDAMGRCAHYRSVRDVVANKCATCGEYWACHACHEELADHPFGRMDVAAADAVLCGACGTTMDYARYAHGEGAPACCACGHLFNPGCSLHAGIYFAI